METAVKDKQLSKADQMARKTEETSDLKDEALNENGILNPDEALNENGILDPDEALNENGILNPDEALNENGILNPDETLNENGILNPDETLNENGILNQDEALNENGILNSDETLNENGILNPECERNRSHVSAKLLKNDKKAQKRTKECYHQLTDASLAEGCKYQYVYGDIKPECNVTVKENQVQFENLLKNETLYESETLKLECQLNKPDVSVKWLKDDLEITGQDRIKVLTDACDHRLIISDVRTTDSGKYQCAISNGDLKSECKVTVKDKAGLLKVSVLLLVCVNLLSLLMFDFGSLRKDSTLTSDENDLDTQRRIEDIGKTFEFLQKENKINFDSVSKILNKVETIQNVNDLRHQTVVDMISELSSEISIMAYKSDMEKEVSKLHKSIDEMENTYKMSVEQIQATFHNKLEILSDSLSEIETKVTDTRETFDQFKTKAGKEIQSVSASLFNMQITMEHDFKSRLENVKGQLKEIGNAKVKADKILERIQKDVDTMYPNTFDKDKFTLAFMILVAMVMLLAVSVFCLCRRGVSDYSEPSARQMNADPNSVLRQIPSKPLLESGVCIISFDETRTIEYRRQLDSANTPNCRVQEHVIRRHEHIPKLPRCKVYLMCTEFSERNVIIEEPGLGLGDLRRTTYDAVQKLGGYLIILYTRDPGSRRLKEESLYNTNIYCVTHQPELSILNDDGRFLSIYDKLTDHQKTHLRNKIVQNIT